MRGHIKLFTIPVDLEKAAKYNKVKADYIVKDRSIFYRETPKNPKQSALHYIDGILCR